MIKLERTSVLNFENAIRGMRNPMNSWDKSDSFYCEECYGGLCEYGGWNGQECPVTDDNRFVLGLNDLALAKRLVKAGSDHRKFLRQIFVSVDITAPLYWWKEMDTYKVATVANSCSTMHKIHAKEFTWEDFSHEHLMYGVVSGTATSSRQMLSTLIQFLNACRKHYVETKNKNDWWQIIQLLPSSYNQLRNVTLNYETLLNQYHSRRHHKLDEWHTYCDWIETLPYAKELICGDE